MHTQQWLNFLKKTKWNKEFFPLIFLQVCSVKNKLTDLFDLENEFKVSSDMNVYQLQDGFKYRSHNRSLKIAKELFDAKGDLLLEPLSEIIQILQSVGYIAVPKGHSDDMITNHMLRVLKKIRDDKNIIFEIRRFRVPLCHRFAETIIRDTLSLAPGHVITDRDLRIAVVAACLYPLRQNVGSCFATAPAILIQNEQLENMLADLYDLVSTGRITRIISGKEYSVPLSPSPGSGDMKKKVLPLIFSCKHDIPLGLKHALETTGMLDEYTTGSARIDWLNSKLEEFQKTSDQDTIENFFKYLVLQKFLISQEQLDRYYKEKQSFIKRSRRLEIVRSTEISSRMEKCAKADDMIQHVRKIFLSMTENILARVWEYSLASFSETKMEFSRWNLFTSLGLNHEEKGGLGEIIYHFVDKKIKECNQKLEEYQADYEVAFSQLKATEMLLSQASSEAEIRRLKAEFQSRSYHMNACLDLRDRFYKKSSFYPHLYSFMIEQFDQRFPEYFQEIYDADMQEVDLKEYEDSPAGFRLVCKHGRRDASLWSMVYNQEQFIDSLVEFFTYAEPQISSAAEEKNCDDDIKEIITLMIHHVQTETFIRSAFHRSASLHQVSIDKKTLSDLQRSEKKPWSYTSGGVMNTLIKTYYRRDSEISEETFTIQSESDLLNVLIETMKSLPYNFSAYFPEKTNKKVLMRSPTHAFLLLAYENPFFSSWDDNSFTYTWIRDKVVKKWQKFYSSILLSSSEQEFLLREFIATIPEEIRSLLKRSFISQHSCTVQEFARQVIKASPVKGFFSDFLDSFLYLNLPVMTKESVKENVYQVVHGLLGENTLDFLETFSDIDTDFITADCFREICKAVVVSYKKSVGFDFDLHGLVREKAEALFLSAPRAFIFADTNWSQNYFGFVVSPLSLEVKLWRVAKNGYEGIGMFSWAKYLSQNSKDTWGVYVKPQEYSQVFERKL